jgi:hypothetical protein
MSDFERRLSDALRAGSSGALLPTDLDESARARARGRRQTRLGVLGALVAITLPVSGVWFYGGDSEPSVLVADSPTDAPVAPEGWRTESWRSVTLLVPDSWSNGEFGGCAPAMSDDPFAGGYPTTVVERVTAAVVERPGRVSAAIACWSLSTLPYGVRFEMASSNHSLSSAELPADAVWREVELAGVHIDIIAPESIAEAIEQSVREIQAVDPNGCPAQTRFAALGELNGPQRDVSAPRLSLCLYVLADGQPRLEKSELLSYEDSDSLRGALGEAPSGRGPDETREGYCGDWQEDQAVLVRSGTDGAWIHFGGCQGHGIDLGGGVTRRLTRDVMYWAFIPGGSSGWSGVIPTPGLLRGE